ncbi:MAG TPA: tetratricopeptide repeat protein, partial [Candidatus Obscuribacter sp.]|nr:tetratricopeptide repeat protein [Candidatus Obscuribacter sp.]
LHCAKRRFEKAEILFKRALEIREKLLGPDDEQLLPILKNYAALLRKLEREEEAVRLEERIAALER